MSSSILIKRSDYRLRLKIDDIINVLMNETEIYGVLTRLAVLIVHVINGM